MNSIIFECNAVQSDSATAKENNENHFVLNENSLVINMIDTKQNKTLANTEIDKESEIELGKLILMRYKD